MMTARHAVPSPLWPARAGALAALALALLCLAACGVDRRSDEYLRCENPSQCPSRMCDRGWCVPPTAVGSVDAATPGTPDAMVTPAPVDAATVCPAVCTSCEDGVCIIACHGSGSCPGQIVCPAGWPCEVECVGIETCGAGVSCGDATECAVRCQGAGSCMSGVFCGAGPCDVDCSGPGACLVIACSGSCACDTECGNGALCTRECPEPSSSCQSDGECSSSDCDTCADALARPAGRQ